MNKNKYPAIVDDTLIQFIEKNCPIKEPCNILEIGCNTGYNLKALQKKYPNCKYYGIDMLKDAIKEAKKYIPNGVFIKRDIENQRLFFRKETFDYILFPNVIEHFYDPNKVMEKILPLLKPDGYIVMAIPNIMHYTILMKMILMGIFPYEDTGLLDFDHKKFFTFLEIEKFCNKLNLNITASQGLDLPPNTQAGKRFLKQILALDNNLIKNKPSYYTCLIYYIAAQKKQS